MPGNCLRTVDMLDVCVREVKPAQSSMPRAGIELVRGVKPRPDYVGMRLPERVRHLFIAFNHYLDLIQDLALADHFFGSLSWMQKALQV
ncbi:MAG TPA: hypothetical protein VLX91_12320 [Candidatus Acidoferrales bacterium]|nr:hypothetical protein [Candidatus Acidoferrales bacterium]